ncbi:hypothetical protein [Hyphomicrobium sp. CS1BSMeth3]|uniref:hypothetical protein n=1 Tax=Hyphomicrobium sp. CS1BSMeth3 TaxID=1892844 RepID=UPI00092FE807|nr:hypothetical protein [Hyphomicrobium sp. CS1BSMeth3]
MKAKGLPIEGYPHFTLAGQEDELIFARTLANLRAAGFEVHADRLVPPAGTDSPRLIAAISSAFQQAKMGRRA